MSDRPKEGDVRLFDGQEAVFTGGEWRLVSVSRRVELFDDKFWESYLHRSRYGNDLGRTADYVDENPYYCELDRRVFSRSEMPKHGEKLEDRHDFRDGRNRHYFSR